jgi:hypothetical protein
MAPSCAPWSKRASLRASNKEIIMSLKTAAKLSILCALAGVAACDPAAKVERAQEQEQKVANETAEKRAELSREHRDEAADMVKDQRQERADLDQKSRETVLGEQKEAVKLGTEQIQERARLENKQAEKANEARNDLNQASAELDQQRIKLMGRERERLDKINTRVSSITTRAQGVKPEDKTVIDRELSGFPEARDAAERDIEALTTVTAQNLKRAEKAVDTQLAKLEKKLDRAEDKL